MLKFIGYSGVGKFINHDDLIEKVFPLYLFRYAIIIFHIKNENENQHQRSILQKNWNYCTNRWSRSTALNAKINLQQCFPNRMLPNPAKFFITTHTEYHGCLEKQTLKFAETLSQEIYSICMKLVYFWGILQEKLFLTVPVGSAQNRE